MRVQSRAPRATALEVHDGLTVDGAAVRYSARLAQDCEQVRVLVRDLVNSVEEAAWRRMALLPDVILDTDRDAVEGTDSLAVLRLVVVQFLGALKRLLREQLEDAVRRLPLSAR